MELTRRQLPSVLAASLPAAAQSAGAESPEELLKTASDRLRRNAEAIAKVAVPMATEPAFSFRAQDHG